MASVEDALQRLNGALTRLEAVVARRVEADEARGDHALEMALMDEDRARLAAELDAASARLLRMTAVTNDVENRLGHAIETVETVLATRATHPGTGA